jgi:hypothetical protein
MSNSPTDIKENAVDVETSDVVLSLNDKDSKSEGYS